jgi:hypothetical protein
MNSYPDVERVLSVAGGKINPKKLELLKRKLEEALGKPLSSQTIEDPVIIRHLLAVKLKDDGMSAGMVHSLEQSFMGIIRRAAVLGLLPAPPEGPWTYEWQSVLDISSEVRGARSIIRSLASWATAHSLAPHELNTVHLTTWVKDMMMKIDVLLIVEKVLALWSSSSLGTQHFDFSHLLERLQKRASRGTVRASADQDKVV